MSFCVIIGFNVGGGRLVPTANTYLRILAMMDDLSDEELNALFRDLKEIIDTKAQPAQKATFDSDAFSPNGTGKPVTDSSLDKDETHPTKPA